MDNSKWYQKDPFIILLLVVFFPVGLYLMWKYSDWNPKAKWVVTGVLLFFPSIIGVTDEGSEAIDNSSNSSQGQVSENQQPTLTLEEKLLQSADEIVGSHDNVEVIVTQAEANLIFEEEVFYTTDSAIRDAYEYFVKWGEKALAHNEINYVSVEAKTQFIDEKGATSMDRLIKVGMDEENFNQFEWKNLNYQPIHNQLRQYGDIDYPPQVWRDVNFEEDAFLSL